MSSYNKISDNTFVGQFGTVVSNSGSVSGSSASASSATQVVATVNGTVTVSGSGFVLNYVTVYTYTKQ